tara:strand:+ start:29215 stop:30363 length:1149 start_codon:yes stop_codon:yes gene_type:complete
MDRMEIFINTVKIVVIFLMMIQVVPLLVWVERRGSAFIQHRFGPNRVGPLGLLQLLADAVKFINKEEFVPAASNRVLFYLAPILALLPGMLAVLAIPFSTPFGIPSFEFMGSSYGPYTLQVQGAEIPLGIIYIFGVSSLAAYPVLLAGWASSNKYSLMGGLRASAQTISYELGLGMSVVGVMMLYGTFHLNDMIAAQEGLLAFRFFGNEINLPFLPNWGIFFQPIGFILFFVCIFAESNRLPFDLPEAEAELVAGFHTEYSGFKMLMFYIGEYGHMIVGSALVVIFYFGGYHIPYVSEAGLTSFVSQYFTGEYLVPFLVSFIYLHVFILKLALFLWIFVWVRWSLPRFRYDQLMSLGWKTLLPWSIFNMILTTVFIYAANAA